MSLPKDKELELVEQKWREVLQGFVERGEPVPEQEDSESAARGSSLTEQAHAFRLADAQVQWERMSIQERGEWLARAQARKASEPAARHLSDERVALLSLADSL